MSDFWCKSCIDYMSALRMMRESCGLNFVAFGSLSGESSDSSKSGHFDLSFVWELAHAQATSLCDLCMKWTLF